MLAGIFTLFMLFPDIIAFYIPGPVWQLGDELHDDKYLPDKAELEDLKNRLNTELGKLV